MKANGQEVHGQAVGLSSIVLNGVRVLNILAGAAIGVMLVVSLVAPGFLFTALGVRATEWGMATLSMRGIMIAGIVAAAITHRILLRLLEILDSVRFGDPFMPGNGRRLETIAWSLAWVQVLHLTVGGLIQLASTPAQPFDFGWSFSALPSIAALLLFVLAGVFDHGARLRDRLAGAA